LMCAPPFCLWPAPKRPGPLPPKPAQLGRMGPENASAASTSLHQLPLWFCPHQFAHLLQHKALSGVLD
jgi:hypothetical protein